MKKRLRLFLLYTVALVICNSIFGQERKTTGHVADRQNQPLAGVTIKIKGKSISAVTDANGAYSIAATPKDVLIFTSVGFEETEVVLGTQSLSVKLNSTVSTLNDVVVIGYGTSRKQDLTGSVATLNAKDFQKIPLSNAEELIANKLPGVQAVPYSGKPGAGSSFLIRGGASLNASNDPLIVIDGIALEGWNAGPGMLSQLNPNDIESFSVLKDASASAIYGSRASNGVIIITTKKGAKGKIKINFSTNERLATLVNKIPVLSGDQYRTLVKTLGSTSTPVGTASTDWQKEIFHPAVTSDFNIGLSGAYKFLPYRVSVGYLNQDGILKTGNYKRLTALVNLNPTFFTNHLKVNLSIKASSEKQRIANESALGAAVYFDPTQAVHVADTTYGGYFQYSQYASNPALATINPVSSLAQVQNTSNTLRSYGNLQLDYSVHFLPDLHINVNAGYDVATTTTAYATPANYFPDNVSLGTIYNANPASKVSNKLFETYLFYSKEIKKLKSKVDATAGYSYNDYLTTNYGYATFSANGTQKPNSTPTFPFDKPSHSIISFYGRLNYIFNQKYLFTATIRDDGSSRFPVTNRWGLFPSAAFAWKIAKENFLKNSKVISDLKLRIGYGVTGQQDGIGNYLSVPTYSIGGATSQYNIGNNAYLSTKPIAYNANLKWEQTATTNIGLDFGFLNNRISGNIDVYQKNTSNLLNQTTIPLGVNFTNSLLLNIGSMMNKGVEMLVKVIPIQNNKITWDINLNASFNQNNITHLNNVSDSGVGLFSNKILVNTVGQSRNTYYLYHQVYNKAGLPIEDQMVDVNNDGLINSSDRYITSRSSLPKYMLGFSSNFQYIKWTVGCSIHSDLGQYIYYHPSDNSIAVTGYNTSNNLSTAYYNSLFSKNDQNQGYSDFYLQNASFLKIDNLYIGHDFGKLLHNSNAVLKASVSVQNIYTITKYTGQDPEAGGNSGYQNNYPIPRTYALAVNIVF